MIDKWRTILSLDDWIITTESIDPKSVTYDMDCPSEDRYCVGIVSHGEIKEAILYHDRELTERDVIHELLHVRYPDWKEDQVNQVEELLYKLK
jgi:hypothetical protein